MQSVLINIIILQDIFTVVLRLFMLKHTIIESIGFFWK